MGQLFDSYSYFDGVEMEPVTQTTWANYWRGIIPDGIVAEIGEEMRPYANSTGMYVYVSPGACIVDNHRGVNAALKMMAVNTADPDNPRIDMLVARAVYGNENESYMELDILTGTPAIEPAAPALTQATGDVYEIPLAQIYVGAGVETLNAADVSDLRSVFTAGSQSTSYINDDDVALTKGMLVYLSRETVGAVKRCPKGYVPIGIVTAENIPVGGRGQVSTIPGTIEEISCTEDEVQLGDALIPSETAGVAQAGSGYAGGLALEAKAAGAVGNVKSLLAVLSNLPSQNGWYLPNGITEDNVLAAYQFVGRQSEAEALINVNHGTEYVLTKSVNTILWNSLTGLFIPAENSAGLRNADLTGLAEGLYTAVIGFHSLPSTASRIAGGIAWSRYRILWLKGLSASTTYRNAFSISQSLTTTNITWSDTLASAGVLGGNFPNQMYYNGAVLTNAGSAGRSNTTSYDIANVIGQVTDASARDSFYVTAAAFYNTTLSAAQHLELANRIRAFGGIG